MDATSGHQGEPAEGRIQLRRVDAEQALAGSVEHEEARDRVEGHAGDDHGLFDVYPGHVPERLAPAIASDRAASG